MIQSVVAREVRALGWVIAGGEREGGGEKKEEKNEKKERKKKRKNTKIKWRGKGIFVFCWKSLPALYNARGAPRWYDGDMADYDWFT